LKHTKKLVVVSSRTTSSCSKCFLFCIVISRLGDSTSVWILRRLILPEIAHQANTLVRIWDSRTLRLLLQFLLQLPWLLDLLPLQWFLRSCLPPRGCNLPQELSLFWCISSNCSQVRNPGLRFVRSAGIREAELKSPVWGMLPSPSTKQSSKTNV